jgi:non-ribosomal peptide synthetase component F
VIGARAAESPGWERDLRLFTIVQNVKALSKLSGFLVASDPRFELGDLLLMGISGHGPCPEIPGLCVQELFERQEKAVSPAVALVAGEEWLTYRELNEKANRLAHRLISHGIGPDRLVPVCPEKRLRHLISAAGCSLLLTDRLLGSPLTALLRILNLRTPVIRAALHDQPASNPCRPSQAGQLAHLLSISGSTGTPRGVLIEHGSSLRLLQLDPTISFDSSDGFLQLAPATSDAATFEIWGALLSGARLVLFPPPHAGARQLADTLRGEALSRPHGLRLLGQLSRRAMP